MDHLSSSAPRHLNRAKPRGGFTLIEILVAVAIMSLLLTIIMVPLRLAFDSFHTGKARGEVQQQAQLSLQQITTDLRRAKFIFPNSYVPGVSDNTDQSPCTQVAYPAGWNRSPYVISTDSTKTGDPSTTVGVTGTGVAAWDDPARLDMLFLRQSNSNGLTADIGADYVVTYYARRFDITKSFDIVDNPVVLYRAQYPYRYYDGTLSPPKFKDFLATSPAGALNAQIDNSQYPALGSSSNATTDRNFSWITHNFYGEANLEPLCTDYNTSPTIAGAHTLITPRDMGLLTPRSDDLAIPANAAEALVPELSFVEEATNGKRIDRVTVNMTLAQYDRTGAGLISGQAPAQRVRVSQTVDIPNVGCSP